ncbi:MAG: site-specific integrase [Vicinamibacteria bacterium]|jgi:integrase|nr:site-specific integrase [Vicinamibacteria bacterium]
MREEGASEPVASSDACQPPFDRAGDLAGCERRDVEISERQGSIHIRPEVSKGGCDRSVPLAKEARNFPLAYLGSSKDDDPARFVGQRGPLTDQGIRDIVTEYVGVFPHRLRHAFAYEYLRANKNDLVALADILGHESLNTTRHSTRDERRGSRGRRRARALRRAQG